MSDKISEVDWENDEAVVREAVPEVFFTKNGCVWDSELGLRKAWIDFPHDATKSCHLLGRSWKRARHESSVVQAFERENRPASEVEAAKKAVLAKWPDAYMSYPQYAGDIWVLKEEPGGTWLGEGNTENDAWLDAASKLTPAAVADAPKRVTEAMRRITNRFEVIAKDGKFDVRDTQFIENELLDVWDHHQIVPNSPVGEREGEFEYVRKPQLPIRAVKWTGENLKEVREVYPGLGEEYMRDKGCAVGFYVISPHKGRVYFQDAASFEEKYARAALSSKPSAEGIPKERFYLGQQERDALEATISGKDAELMVLFGKCTELLTECRQIEMRAEAAEAELAALKLSSARMLEAINWACGCGGEFPGRGADDGTYYWRSELTKRGGLAYDGEQYVIPTSPESQEEGE